ncbi:ERI1 exoribonuclease 2 [Salminus brasiliensis]|uniref:ERI1 exoribonuclease 2 n=1 Tax=Salminus brasiliensis TaxID=930266 RepID=UPI003B839753
MFSYLIVIDFESTCWREKNNLGQEIIEFPAVLLNTSNGQIESEFHSYVQPQEHPVLSEFCTELTGITQVEAGLPLQICLSRFTRWLHALQQEKGVVYVTDSRSTPASGHLCTFLTWSDWDLGVCLLYECKRKQIAKPEALNSWIDLRASYRTFYSRRPKGLNGALQDLGIQFSGREHSGLDDARNTARLAWRMVTDGCVLKITKSLNRAPLKSRPMFGEVCVRSEGQRNTRPPVEENQPSHSGNHGNGSSAGNPNTVTSVCQSLVSTRTVLTTLITPVCVNTPQLHTTLQNTTHTSTLGAAAGLETTDCDWTDGFLVTEAEESGSYDDMLLEDGECGGVDGSEAPALWDREESTLPSNTFNKPHTEVNKPHLSKLRPSTPASTFVSLLPLSNPYRSLSRPGHCATTTTPIMPFTIYTDQSHQSSSDRSAAGLFKVPYPVLSSSVNQSKLSSISNNQSTSSSTSINQSAQLSTSFHSASNTHPGYSSVSKNQSVFPASSVSSNQSKPSFSVNQSALSFISSNQSLGFTSSTNQSKHLSVSNKQSDLHSISINQSWAACSTNQSESSSVSDNQSIYSNQSALSSYSANRPRSSSTINQSSSSSSCYNNQSKRSSVSFNQPPPSSCCSERRPLPFCRSDGENTMVTKVTKVTKVTSPLCACGRRAKRLTVGNGGPNHGRGFYTCPVRRSGSDSAHSRGCGFFKWESAVINSSLKPNRRISFSVKTPATRNLR